MSDLHPLADAVSHPSPAKESLARWRVAAGLLVAPLAFSLLVVAGYAAAADECEFSGHPNWLVVLIDIIGIGGIALGFLISISNYRAAREEADGGHRHTQDIGEGRTRFLAYAGLCASGIFALAAIVQLTSALLLDQCLGLPVLP